MADAPVAVQKGYVYQALFFWTKALQLLNPDYYGVENVAFEAEDVCVVDDVVVKYKDGYKECSSGEEINIDFFQLKHHMNNDKPFSSSNLLDPEFTSNKECIMKRLYSEYLKYTKMQKKFRMYIVSTCDWDSSDSLHKYIRRCDEPKFNDEFFKPTKKGFVFDFKSKLKDLLALDNDEELNHFLSTLRFKTCTLSHIKEILNPLLISCKLKPVDYSISTNEYEILPWKFLEQRKKRFPDFQPVFSSESLKQTLTEEKLFQEEKIDYDVLFVQSYPTIADKYKQECSTHLSLLECFLQNEPVWELIEQNLKRFYSEIATSDINKEKHLLMQTHLSISFHIGYNLKPKVLGLKIVPTMTDLTPWYEPSEYCYNNWDTEEHNINGEINELIVFCSVTNDVQIMANKYVGDNEELRGLPRLLFKNKKGINNNVKPPIFGPKLKLVFDKANR